MAYDDDDDDDNDDMIIMTLILIQIRVYCNKDLTWKNWTVFDPVMP